MRPQSRAVSLLLALFPSLLVAREIPLVNWTVPPYRGANVSGGLMTMTDLTPGLGFVAIAPCRLVDTRQAGFPAGYGTPALTGGVPRNFDLNSDPQCPGIPAGPGVDVYSLNITVTNTLGPGFILIYPQGSSQPTVSTVNYVAGQTIANAAIVPGGNGGGVTVIAGVSGADLIIDINGYFTDQYNPNTPFVVIGNTPLTGVLVASNSNIGTTSFGITGITASTADGSSGILGFNEGAVRAASGFSSSGVRGETGNIGIGVFGLTNLGGSGVAGYRVSELGALQAGSELGFTTTVGLQTFGTTQATGVKNFIEPHPTDASKMIRYTSLEGNEAGTYFRGRGKFQNGTAVIDVPEDFRIVTDPEGLSIQITPIGDMATVAVQSIGLDRIVVRGSRNVEFFYTVNGIRHAYKDVGPIAENEKVFVPRSADEAIPQYLPETIRQRLISNGTYTGDGKVNLDTAHRLGWDRQWEKRARPTPQPTE